jgi:hypothetical protein
LARKRQSPPTFEQFLDKLRQMKFDVSDSGGGRYFVTAEGCAAGVERGPEGNVAFFARPGRIVRGELARLIDRGYQKFLKTADAEVPALAEDLSAIARFWAKLKYAAGSPLLYNESLGSVSDRYLYDRVWYRDTGQQPKCWESSHAAEPRALGETEHEVGQTGEI